MVLQQRLTAARSGSAGFVSFQPNGCVVGDSAKVLIDAPYTTKGVHSPVRMQKNN